jgi:hypothetical protein
MTQPRKQNAFGETPPRITGPAPKKVELVRLECKPAILDPAILVKQIEREVADVTEAGQNGLTGGKERGGVDAAQNKLPQRQRARHVQRALCAPFPLSAAASLGRLWPGRQSR